MIVRPANLKDAKRATEINVIDHEDRVLFELSLELSHVVEHLILIGQKSYRIVVIYNTLVYCADRPFLHDSKYLHGPVGLLLARDGADGSGC